MRIRPRTLRRLTLLAGVAVLLIAIGVSAVFVRRWQKTRALDRLRADAIARYVEGEHAEALPMLAQYERNRPGDAEILLALARVRREVEMGDQSHIAKAARLYQSYRAIVPGDTEASIELLELYALLGQHSDAISLAQRILSDESVTGARRAEVLLINARALRAGDPESAAAEARVREAVEQDPSSFEAQLELAKLLRDDDITLACEHARDLTENSDDVRFRLIELISCDERWVNHKEVKRETLDGILALATEAPGDAFTDDAFVNELLSLAEEIKRDDITIKALRRAAETGDKGWATRYIRRLYQMDLFEDVAGEAPRIAELVEGATEDFNAYALIARLEIDDAIPADLISAAEELEAASGRGRFREKAWASAFRGMYAQMSGDINGADTFLADATENYPAEPLLHMLHGEVLAELQRFEPARSSWKTAQDLAGVPWRSLERRVVQSFIGEGRYREAFDGASAAIQGGGAGWKQYYAWYEAFVELLIRGRATVGEIDYAASSLPWLASSFEGDNVPPEAALDFEKNMLSARVALAAVRGEPIEPVLERPIAVAAMEDDDVFLHLINVIDRLGLEFPPMVSDLIAERAMVHPQLSLAMALRAFQNKDPSAAGMLATPDGADDIPWAIARAGFTDRTASTPEEQRAAAEGWRALFDAHPENLDVLAAIFESENAPLDAELITLAADNRARITGSQGESAAASVVLSRAMAVRRGNPTPNEHAAALAALQQVVTRSPSNTRARIYLAELFIMDRPDLGIKPDRARAARELLAASELIGGSGADVLRSQGARILHSINDFQASREALFRIVDSESNPSPELLHQAGQILLAQGDPDAALGFLTRAEPLADPDDRASVLVQIGRAREARLEDAEATAAYIAAAEAGLNGADDVLQAATHFDRIGDEPRRAAAMARLDVIELEPGRADLIRARHAWRRGETEEADRLYESVVARQPGWSTVWAELGNVRITQGDLEGAADAVSRGLEHDPDSDDLHYLREQIELAGNIGADGEVDYGALADIYEQQAGGGRIAEGARALDEASKKGLLDSRDALLELAAQFADVQNVQNMIGTRLIDRLGAYDDAGDLLMRAAERFPADAELARLATIAFENAGDWESMRAAAMLWRSRDPLDAASSDLAIAESTYRLGRSARADELVAPYLDGALADPDDMHSLRVLWLWTRLRIDAGDEAVARDRLEPLIGQATDLRRLVWLRAAAELIPDWDTAQRWLDIAETHEPGEFGTAYIMDTCRRRADLGLPDTAAAVDRAGRLAASISETEDSVILKALADLARLRAERAAAAGRQADADAGYREAVERFLAASEKEPTGSQAWIGYRRRAAVINENTGRLDDAIELYRSTLASVSDMPALAAEMRNDLAFALTRRAAPDDLEAAESEITLALAAMNNPSLHHTRGKILEARGEAGQAAAAYRAALALDPDHPASLASLALLLAQGSPVDQAEARQYIERSVEIDLSGVAEGIRNEFATAASLLDDG